MEIVKIFCKNINFTIHNDISINQFEFVKFIVLNIIKKVLPIILTEVGLNEEAIIFSKVNNLSDIRNILEWSDLEKKYINLYYKIVESINNARGFNLNSMYEFEEHLFAINAITEIIYISNKSRELSTEICKDALTKLTIVY